MQNREHNSTWTRPVLFRIQFRQMKMPRPSLHQQSTNRLIESNRLIFLRFLDFLRLTLRSFADLKNLELRTKKHFGSCGNHGSLVLAERKHNKAVFLPRQWLLSRLLSVVGQAACWCMWCMGACGPVRSQSVIRFAWAQISSVRRAACGE